MSLVVKETIPFCVKGNSFRYYVPNDKLDQVWTNLVSKCGAFTFDPIFKTYSIKSDQFIITVPELKTPFVITYYRTTKTETMDEVEKILGL